MNGKNLLMKAAMGIVLALGIASTSSAATLSIVGGTPGVLPAGTGGTSGFDLSSIYGSASPNVNDPVSIFTGATPFAGGAGLQISATSNLTYTFLGKEAAAKNAVFSMGGNSISNTQTVGSSFVVNQTGPGFVNFFFSTIETAWGDINGNWITGETLSIFNNGASAFSGLKIAFGSVFNNGKSVLAFFGDGRGDADLDDMVIRIDAVPLPAAGLMLFGALAGLGALRRRKKVAIA